MSGVSKSFSVLFIVLLAVSSLIMVTPAFAQNSTFTPTPAPTPSTIPTPSVPEFTVNFVNDSYMVITIKNHPYNYSSNGTTYNLYYNIRMKGHFEQDWTELYPVSNVISQIGESFGNSEYIPSDAPSESNSDYTVLSYHVGANSDYPFNQLPANGQEDFQVEAVIGHVSQVSIPNEFYPFVQTLYMVIVFDTSSGWSNTVTATVISSTTLSAFLITVAVIVALVVGVVAMTFRHRKTAKLKQEDLFLRQCDYE